MTSPAAPERRVSFRVTSAPWAMIRPAEAARSGPKPVRKEVALQSPGEGVEEGEIPEDEEKEEGEKAEVPHGAKRGPDGLGPLGPLGVRARQGHLQRTSSPNHFWLMRA